MPGKDAHALVGFAAGVAAIPACRRVLTTEPSPIEKGIAIIASMIGSCTPDWLEPADSPEHRGFCHSYIGGILVAAGTVKAVSELQKELEKLEAAFIWYRENRRPIPTEDLSLYQVLRCILCFVAGFSCGYESHLTLDCLTPKSLPLLGL
ncbi:MAG: metal-dependent hydrolase [Candidatus Fermentibacter sp.]|nr:metal-dependent hydrolase [Candidatus Fermentibacter sp.]